MFFPVKIITKTLIYSLAPLSFAGSILSVMASEELFSKMVLVAVISSLFKSVILGCYFFYKLRVGPRRGLNIIVSVMAAGVTAFMSIISTLILCFLRSRENIKMVMGAVLVQTISFLCCLILFKAEEFLASMFGSKITMLYRRIQLKQQNLCKVYSELRELEGRFEIEISDDLRSKIYLTKIKIQKICSQINRLRRKIGLIDRNRILPPGYCNDLLPGEVILDSNMSRFCGEIEITRERENEIRKLENGIREKMYGIDSIYEALQGEDLSEEDKEALELEFERIRAALEEQRSYLQNLLQSSCVPLYVYFGNRMNEIQETTV